MGRLPCTVSPQHPPNPRIPLLPSPPISPITRRPSGTHTADTPAQTPTRLPPHKAICPNDVLACQAPRATKKQAATHSAPFTGRHPPATFMQRKPCYHCCHPCPTANCGAKPNALSESTRQSRRPVHHHSIPWHSTPNQRCHLIFIMHPSITEQCRPPQSHNVAEANHGTDTDHRCSFPHTSNHKTARQNRQHQKTPLLFTRSLQSCAMRTICA